MEARCSISSAETIAIPTVWLVFALAWLSFFFCWFNSFSLPNNPGVHRWMLWTLVPFDLFDLIDPPVITGAAPWSWFFLFQRLPFALIAAAIWIGAWGAGSVALRWIRAKLLGLERVFFSCCCGLSILSVVTLLLGISACLNRGMMIGLLLAGPIIETLYWFRADKTARTDGLGFEFSSFSITPLSRTVYFSLMIVAPFVIVQMVGAMSPQIDFDVVEYHLGGPKEWFQLGHISRLPHNVYTNFPFLSEMLILAGMVLYGDWQWGALAGQATIAGFIPLTALGLYAAGHRWFSTSVGGFAALIYLTSPWTYRISIIAYAEGSLACYLFAALYAALIWRQGSVGEGDPSGCPPVLAGQNTGPKKYAFSAYKYICHSNCPFALLTGAMSGSAMACKYPGFISVVIPIGLFVFSTAVREQLSGRSRRFAIVGIMFLLGVLATVGPWLLKNTIATGNPVYPLAVRLFGGVDRDEKLDRKWRDGHAARYYSSWSERLKDLPVKLADVSANNDWHSPLMFGLAPLSLMWFLRRKLRAVDSLKQHLQAEILCITWLYVVWQFSTWWLFTHHIDRFYVPMFSAVALLAGVGANWPMLFDEGRGTPRTSAIWQWCSGAILLASILYNADVMIHLGGFNAGRIDLKAAEEIATPGHIRWLNKEFESGRLTPSFKVLCVGEAQMFHARYSYLYNTVFDHCLFEELCAERGSTDQKLRPINEIRADFHRLGITHIEVNWAEIERYRAPGSYGYTDFVQPERFAELQQQGLLGASLFTTVNEKTGATTGQIFPIIDE